MEFLLLYIDFKSIAFVAIDDLFFLPKRLVAVLTPYLKDFIELG